MRRRRVVRALALLAAAGFLVLVVNAVVAERQTKPAEAGVGRILELPGGDIQVREDGRGEVDPHHPDDIII